MNDTKKIIVWGATSDLSQQFIADSSQSTEFTLVARSKEKMLSVYGMDANHKFLECDVSDDAAVKRITADLTKTKTKFDCVLCSVGMHEVMPLRLYSGVNFRKIVEANFFSVANVLRGVSSLVASGGSIVVVSSAVTSRGSATVSAYASAKGAVEALMRSAALEFASKNIRVNAIAPGIFKSKMSDKLLSTRNEEQLRNLEASHPLGLGSCEQVVGIIEFLFSERSSWITGQTIFVDGGYSINA